MTATRSPCRRRLPERRVRHCGRSAPRARRAALCGRPLPRAAAAPCCARRRTTSSFATATSRRMRRTRARSSKATRGDGCSTGSRRSSSASSACRARSSSCCSTLRSRSRASSSAARRRAGTRRWRRTSTKATPSHSGATREVYLELARRGSMARRLHCERRRRPPRHRRDRRRSVGRGGTDPAMTFTAVPEQAEAKRLLAAALAEGPAHAYLLHGPPGVGKRAIAFLFAAELLGEHARVERRIASRPVRARAGRRPDSHRRHPHAAARPAHAPVRGVASRLSALRRRHDERGRRRRAAEGPRGAAVVCGDRPRRERPRPAAGDDSLALPARAVPPLVGARRP